MGAAIVTSERAESGRDGELTGTIRVDDDGTGFEVATTPEGVGITGSIRGRVDSLGGRVEFRSTPGDGAEVCMWVPCPIP